MAAEVVRIDDADSRILYKGKWSLDPQSLNMPVWNSTMTVTQAGNSSASITFTGNKIAAYALLGKMMPPTLPHMTRYDLDDRSPVTLELKPSSPIGSLPVRQIRLYESPLLAYGEHTLTMTNVKDLNWVWFDYFEVTTTLDQSSVASGVSPIPSTSLSDTVECKKSSTGAIVGATLGGALAALLLTSVILFMFWRKKKQCSSGRGSHLPQHSRSASIGTSPSEVSSVVSYNVDHKA